METIMQSSKVKHWLNCFFQVKGCISETAASSAHQPWYGHAGTLHPSSWRHQEVPTGPCLWCFSLSGRSGRESPDFAFWTQGSNEALEPYSMSMTAQAEDWRLGHGLGHFWPLNWMNLMSLRWSRNWGGIKDRRWEKSGCLHWTPLVLWFCVAFPPPVGEL